MATYYVEQVTNELNGLAPAKDIGAVERRYFCLTVPSGGYAAGSIIIIGLIRAPQVAGRHAREPGGSDAGIPEPRRSAVSAAAGQSSGTRLAPRKDAA